MSDVTDINQYRTAKAQPDPEFVSRDDYGRALYTFLVDYDFGEKTFSFELIAYDEEDARAKIAAIRGSARYEGKLFSRVRI